VVVTQPRMKLSRFCCSSVLVLSHGGNRTERQHTGENYYSHSFYHPFHSLSVMARVPLPVSFGGHPFTRRGL
jgi:hypothetical protein